VDEQRLDFALEAAGFGVFEWDAVRRILTLDRRAAGLSGLPEGESRKIADWDDLVPAEDIARVRRMLAERRTPGQGFKIEIRVRRPDDGRTVWLWISGVTQQDASGRVTGMNGIVGDITDFKFEEERRQALVAEVDHRVKNVLAAVQALAYQTAKRTTSLDAFLQNFSGRLKALGSANELLTAARWRGAAVEHVAAAELGALAPGQTSWAGPELFLTPRAANALALALHELATNAVKSAGAACRTAASS
jgi:PAS domain S-box-containing protein